MRFSKPLPACEALNGRSGTSNAGGTTCNLEVAGENPARSNPIAQIEHQEKVSPTLVGVRGLEDSSQFTSRREGGGERGSTRRAQRSRRRMVGACARVESLRVLRDLRVQVPFVSTLSRPCPLPCSLLMDRKAKAGGRSSALRWRCRS